MNINEELKIVIPIRSNAKGETLIWGYHTPISRTIFEQNYRILAATKAEISKHGNYYRLNNGPSIALLTLSDVSRKDSIENGLFDQETGQGFDKSAQALLNELKRLTVIIAPSEGGYDQLPIDAAISKGLIDRDEWSEAESTLVFFTCFYALAKKSDKADMLKAVADVLKALSTSLPPMEFIDSLQTSTKVEPTDKKAASSAQSLPT